MCVRCASLEEEVAYLRGRLAERLDADLVRILAQAFELTAGQAKVIALLYQARTAVPIFDIEDAIRGDHAVERSLDGNLVSAFAYQVRRKLGRDFIVTTRGVGYTLSDEARRYIAKAIGAAAEARLASTPKPPRPDAAEAWQRDWTPLIPWLETSRRAGLSYDEMAAAAHVTRGAIGGAIHRHLRVGG